MSRDTELIESHLPLVRRIASVLARRLNGDVEEFYSAGLVGLVQAARRFDPSRHNHFGWYAHDRIRGAILDNFRKLDKLTRNQRYTRKAHPERAHEFHTERTRFSELLRNPSTRVETLPELERTDTVRTLLSKLTHRQRRVVEMYYFEEKTLKEIGRDLGFTESNACLILKNAHQALAKEVAQSGITLND